ncbi:MAG: tetratricopeptide repeat protein [Planctomycetes bacterium]|nr:tetratricopeptide repeat protein [Planctomycetota bacterium]
MTSQKKRNRARRQVERTMSDAFDALERGEQALALKLGRRAIEAGHVNPRIWNDHGRLALACGLDAEAADCFRQALQLAPTFADALANLAAVQASLGRCEEAVRLARRAVELAPEEPRYREALARFEHDRGAPAPAAVEPLPAAEREPPRGELTARHDWDGLAEQVVRHGAAVVRELCDPDCVASLASLWDSDAVRHGLVERHARVGHDAARDAAGPGDRRGDPPLGGPPVGDPPTSGPAGDEHVLHDASTELRMLRGPLPAPLDAMRRELYGRAADVASCIDAALHRERTWPRTLERHLGLDGGLDGGLDSNLGSDIRSGRAASAWPLVWLARLGDGAGVHPVSIDSPRAAFPLAFALDLGGGGNGGELFIDDLRPGRKLRRRAFRTRVGDALLYSVAERVVTVGGHAGLQRIATGRSPATGGERLFLELRFDDE